MDLIQGAVDPQGGYVSKILHVKTKESGPVGGRAPGAPPLDPPMKGYQGAILVVRCVVSQMTPCVIHTHDLISIDIVFYAC